MKGFKGASRGLEKDFQGLEKGFKSFSPSSPVSSGKGHFKLPLKGTFEGGGSDPAQLRDFEPVCVLHGGSAVLSLTHGPAGNRTTTSSLSATQECRDTSCTTRTTEPREAW